MNDYILYMFPAVIIGIGAMVLHMKYMHTTEHRQRAWSLAGLAVLWIPVVLLTAHFFCSYARTVEECFLLWTAAFGLCCICAAVQFTLLILSRNKRDVTGLDKMKLKDL